MDNGGRGALGHREYARLCLMFWCSSTFTLFSLFSLTHSHSLSFLSWFFFFFCFPLPPLFTGPSGSLLFPGRACDLPRLYTAV
ncbi:hypothetical protein GGR58DRAFT_478660 [Xylaria digitata]|nr:hypothetical protein GGR58DRAFT_478660 [Xylaria digitata]